MNIKIKKLIGGMAYTFLSPFNHKRSMMKISEADDLLQNFSPRPLGSSICHNCIDNDPEYDLQIIVPAYNVEKYIKQCLDSIFSQKTKYSFLVVVINDGSTDRTLDIINEYKINNNLLIIDQENKGFSGARNSGLKHIYAKYIMFVDSDDYILPNSIEALMNRAYQYDCDIVEGGSYYYTDKLYSNIQHIENHFTSAFDLKGYPCMKVFKSKLFSNIHFPEGFWFEDTINVFLVYPRCEKIFCITDMVYVYRQIRTSISHTYSDKPKAIDTYWVTEQMLKDCRSMSYCMQDEMLNVFLRQVLLNAIRVSNIPKHIGEAIFIRSAELLNEFDINCKPRKKYKKLYKSLKNGDYKNYSLWCKTHR